MEELLDQYTCRRQEDTFLCALNCTSVAGCSDCGCVLDVDKEGMGHGDVLNVVMLLLPIVVLVITVIVPPLTLPTTVSLPMSAFLLFVIRLAYLGNDALLTCSAVLLGMLETLTPLSIMAGAIGLFETMQATGCMPFLLRQMEELTAGSRVAELALIFSFTYLMEGAAGFGTPIALCVPMLIRMGHETLSSIAVVILFSTLATVWGAVGTPLWFGYQSILADEPDPEAFLMEISHRATFCVSTTAFLLMFPILSLLVPWPELRANALFTLMATASTILPSMSLAFVNYEFPSLVGGMVGCTSTALLVRYRVGLADVSAKEEEEDPENQREVVDDDEAEEGKVNDTSVASQDANGGPSEMEAVLSTKQEAKHSSVTSPPADPMVPVTLTAVLMRSFPIWGAVLLLVLTRVKQFGLKSILINKEPSSSIDLASLGTLRISQSGVLQMEHVLLYPNMNWKFEFLYVPFVLPFVVMSITTYIIYRKEATKTPLQIGGAVLNRLRKASVSMVGALILVQLMIRRGEQSPAYILGTVLSDWFQEGFVVVCPLLGALGSFFSGSTTVSNLTFGEIQNVAARNIGTSRAAMLALQAVGGTAGNGVCLHNIIAACTVVDVDPKVEGQIIRKTYKYVLASITISTVIMLSFFFRFS